MEVDVALTKSYLQALSKLPKGIQKKANDFFDKFRENPMAQSINYEKIHDMKDEKVRTVRIDQKYRAIVLHPSNGNTYLFVHVGNHDEAMDWARNRVFDINEKTSAFQVVNMDITENFDNRIQIHEERQLFKTEDEVPSVADMYTEEELLQIGIPKMIIPLMKFVKTMDDLIGLVRDYVSEDIFDILEYCVGGITVEEIIDCFSLEPHSHQDSIEEILSKPVNQSYIKVVTDDEDIMKILDDPIDLWRVFIHPAQRKYVAGNNGIYRGSFQLKGAAGTGKTVVAMHRAKYLSENIYNSDNEKILYTTFSKKLTKSVEYNLKNMCDFEALKRIEVVNLHALIARYLKNSNISYKIIDDINRKKYIEFSLDKAGYKGIYSPNDIINEIDIVLSFYQITDRDSYLKVSRNGTYKRLGRLQRNEVWDIISEYYELLYENNYKEWWMIIRDATSLIEHRGISPYKAIIVDEAQDFGMPEYRFLRALIPEGENDLFIVGDIRQQIYNHLINFSKCNINILGNRTRSMTLNYRNTYEISELADKVINGLEYHDLDEQLVINEVSHPIIRGGMPKIRNFQSIQHEAQYIYEEISNIVAAGTNISEIAIVSRTNNQLLEIISEIASRGITGIPLEDVGIPTNKNFYYGTMHSIKGFEFKVVFLVGANEETIPLRSLLLKTETEKEKNVVLKMEKSLLYVAITRARDMLYITGCPQISYLLNR